MDEYDYWYPDTGDVAASTASTLSADDQAMVDWAGGSGIEFTDNPQVYIPYSGGLSGPFDAPEGIDETGQAYWTHPDGSVMYTPYVDEKGYEYSPNGEATGRTIEDIVGAGNNTVPVGKIPTMPNSSATGIQALLQKLLGGLGGSGSKAGGANWMPWLLAALAASKLSNKSSSAGSNNAVIPKLTANRSQTPYSQQRPAGYRPGQGGITYFNPTTYAAAGGPMGIAGLGSYAAGGKGRLVQGSGDGVSDDVPATIDGQQPARIARGEYVIPARIVAELGNGSTDAGAEQLDGMLDRVEQSMRKSKRGADGNARKHLLA